VKRTPVLKWLAAKGPPGRVPALALLAGLALLLASGSARADFQLYVFDDGVRTNTFTVASGGVISTGMFDTPHFHIGKTVAPGVTLGIVAVSNSPGDPDRSFVNQLTYLAVNTATGMHTLTVSISDVGFTQPSASVLALRNAVNLTWGPAGSGTGPSDTLSFTSFANTNNTPFDADVDPTTPGIVGTAASGSVRSSTLVLSSPDGVGTTDAANSPDVLFSLPSPGSPYSLSDELSVRLGAGSGIEVNGVTNVFPRAIPVPAPSSWVALATSLPLFGLVTWMRRRRHPPVAA
jgi:hypothetical protein